jgi:hypothetical protein
VNRHVWVIGRQTDGQVGHWKTDRRTGGSHWFARPVLWMDDGSHLWKMIWNRILSMAVE